MTQPSQISAEHLRILPEHSGLNSAGELTVGGCSVVDIAAEYGTPLYLFDEAGLRHTMRTYREGLARRWPRSRVCFASKSLPCIAAYAIAAAEGLSVDVVGEGELRLALAAGLDPATIVLHGNAKSAEEVALACNEGVGLVVIDNLSDIDLLERCAPHTQDVLVRVIPEIDANTHPAIATGGKGSKFGLTLEQTRRVVTQLADHPTITVRGIHLHIGSQILDVNSFAEAVAVLSDIGEFDVYNIGGGLGVNYSSRDNAPPIDEYLDKITEVARRTLPPQAELIIEPGRSLVARSGITVYTVRNVKTSHDTFVAVDGGMSDQMNIALTDDRFTALIANRPAEPTDTVAQLVGRQCESGDLLIDRAELAAPRRGDTLILGATGAYGFTFVNNYNGALHPPVVFCRDGTSRVGVRRQTYDELLAPHAPALATNWADHPTPRNNDVSH